ncbi:MAG: hypothetical protein AAF081_10870 [Actinomycetota bacterium]
MKKHLIVMTAVLALVAAACGGGDSSTDTSAPSDPRGQELVAVLQADSDFALSESEANCTANGLLANLDDATINAMLDDIDVEIDQLPNPEDGVKALDAMFDCVDIEEMMFDQMVADGTPEDAARCVAEGFGEDELRNFFASAALPEDQIDEAAAFALMGKMFELAAECGLE